MIEQIEKQLQIGVIMRGTPPMGVVVLQAVQVAALLDYMKTSEALWQTEYPESEHIARIAAHDAARAALGLK